MSGPARSADGCARDAPDAPASERCAAGVLDPRAQGTRYRTARGTSSDREVAACGAHHDHHERDYDAIGPDASEPDAVRCEAEGTALSAGEGAADQRRSAEDVICSCRRHEA